VSVVVPTYNYARFLCQAVDSVLAQSYPFLEIIVVDDGSTDNTREVMSRYSADPRVRYIYQENQHLSAARNTGIREAQGEFIALLDSDDFWAPEKLERQVQWANKHPDAGLIATNIFTFGEGETPAPSVRQTTYPMDGTRYNLQDLLEFTPFSPSSVLIPRPIFETIGLFDIELRSVEDLDMWLRIAERYPVWRINQALTGNRVTRGSMSTAADRMLENHLYALNKLFASNSPQRLPSYLRRIAEARMYVHISWMRHCTRDRAGAVRDILHSMWLWPSALRCAPRQKERLKRLKLFLGYCLGAPKQPQN
jgi:glycosyltransferase involved in cell wall biosynthesis